MLKSQIFISCLVAELLKMRQRPPPKQLFQPFHHISTFADSNFKKPIFKGKPQSDSSHQISSLPLKPDAFCPKQEAGKSSGEVRVESSNLAPELSTATGPPNCDNETPSASTSDADDEDQSISYSPELFAVEGEGDEGSPQRETNAESPSRTFSGIKSPVPMADQPFGSEQASAFDGQSSVIVIKEGTESSQGKKEEKAEEVETQSRQTGSRVHRLSRSWQRIFSTETGNQQPK